MDDRATCTVLIVDDSPEDRETYKSYLRDGDGYIYTFLEAEEVDEALRLCEAAYIDCIFLDYQLPDANGLDFLDRLRAGKARPSIPIVVITGRGSELVAVECLKKGASDYLVKASLTGESLYRSCRNALELNRLNARINEEQREREQAVNELLESEARFRLLVESVKDYAIFMLDPQGRVDSWNAGARKLLGYHDNEVMGEHLRSFFTHEDQMTRRAEADLDTCLEAGRVEAERWYLGKGGIKFWGQGVIAAVKDRFGLLRGFSVVLRDTTRERGGAARHA